MVKFNNSKTTRLNFDLFINIIKFLQHVHKNDDTIIKFYLCNTFKFSKYMFSPIYSKKGDSH